MFTEDDGDCKIVFDNKEIIEKLMIHKKQQYKPLATPDMIKLVSEALEKDGKWIRLKNEIRIIVAKSFYYVYHIRSFWCSLREVLLLKNRR